jgi:DNA-binding NarL/FixJ family response regulator
MTIHDAAGYCQRDRKPGRYASGGHGASGSEALEVFRRLQPDITLMDIQMPDLNGIDATIAIRKEFPQAKIIILTTYEGDARLARA